MLKPIDCTEVLEALIDGRRVFHAVEITGETSLNDLMMCSDLMVEVFDSEIEPQEEQAEDDEEPEEEPEKEPTEKEKKKSCDKGKIKALFEAGRSVQWIADDMGLSWPTVNYHLKNMGLK